MVALELDRTSSVQYTSGPGIQTTEGALKPSESISNAMASTKMHTNEGSSAKRRSLSITPHGKSYLRG